MTRKKLPIGIQTFREIREENHYYVDKTPFALRLIDEGKYYFLSRPRRFGKSLFLDTLAELFAGNEPLFRGLHCHDKGDWTVKYPVIRISFGSGVLDGRAALAQRIHNILRINAENLALPNRPKLSAADGLTELIYWFETGSPTCLVDMITGRRIFLPEIERLEANEALTGCLLGRWLADKQKAVKQRIRLFRLLKANDFPGLEELVTAFFAGIPADGHRKNPIADYEGYYASVFYAYFAALGLEEARCAGRLDMAVRFNGQVYLFEFKVVELEPEGRALQQIEDRGDADKYRVAGQPIHLIGVEFSRKQRRVVGFEVQSVAAR
jgi:hypothetical protein